MRRALVILGIALVAAISIGGAAADEYGQCVDRARDRLQRGQQDPAIGPDRALNAYMADFHACQNLDAQARARTQQRLEQQQTDQQRRNQQLDQQQADQQRWNQQLDQQQSDQQRWNQQLDQQRWNQQRLDQQRARQRDDQR